MARSSGLMSFLRAEYARQQAGKRLRRPVTHVLHNSSMTGTPFKLPEEQGQMLRNLSKKDCFRCKGTGVSKWKQLGREACVCVCVQRRLPEVQAALESQKERIAQEIAKLKAEGASAETVARVEDGAVKLSVEAEGPCPHARADWRMCPHCNVEAAVREKTDETDQGENRLEAVAPSPAGGEDRETRAGVGSTVP